MTSADRHIESANISIEIWKARGHLSKNVEKLFIEQPALGGTMCGNHRHTALQRQLQETRIRIGLVEDWHRVFAASVGEQGKFRFGHAFPELLVTGICAI